MRVLLVKEMAMPFTDLLILGVAKVPDDAPAWITQEHLEACAANEALQREWQPAVGDWYFCRDLYEVLPITDLAAYYSEGCVRPLRTDLGKDDRGHWECDIYLHPDELKPAGAKAPRILSWLDIPPYTEPY
jgi:hypothetical protein